MKHGSMRIKCGNPKCGTTIKADASKLNPAKPLVRCPKCKGINRVKLPEQQHEERTKPLTPKKQLAWLVRHTENQSAETYTLKAGKNTLGRATQKPGCPTPDIEIAHRDDPHVSRGIHCCVEVVEHKGNPEAIITDNNSTNGTFINRRAYRLRPGDEEYLKDGETLQVGRTKFVFKTHRSAASKTEAQTLVAKTDYSPTIIV